ncbi:hypothetical protein GTQ40_11370 [Flavobacteriaceae bacterium R38]|nr:hypothetical protein [Flavobacteriaceae bacterium R38]
MKVLFTLFFSLLIFSNTQAQILKELEHSTPEERAVTFSNEITQALMLTDQQNKLILEINLMHAHKIVPIIHSKSNKLSKLKKIKSLDKFRDKELDSVLTDGQFVLYLKHKKEFIKNTRIKLKSVAIK